MPNIQYAWWSSLHHAFVGYVLPVLLLVSTLQNLFTLAALCGTRQGIGRTTRALFMALAITELYNLLMWYGLQGIADYGLHYLTHGNFYFRAISQNNIVCKTLRALGYFGVYCSHWLYVLVNIDRLLAVLTPQRTNFYRSHRCLLMLIVLLLIGGLLNGIFIALLYHVKYSTFFRGKFSFLPFSKSVRFLELFSFCFFDIVIVQIEN